MRVGSRWEGGSFASTSTISRAGFHALPRHRWPSQTPPQPPGASAANVGPMETGVLPCPGSGGAPGTVGMTGSGGRSENAISDACASQGCAAGQLAKASAFTPPASPLSMVVTLRKRRNPGPPSDPLADRASGTGAGTAGRGAVMASSCLTASSSRFCVCGRGRGVGRDRRGGEGALAPHSQGQ